MSQKIAAYNSEGAIVGFYDSPNIAPPDPLPTGIAGVIEISDADYAAACASQAHTVVNGALVAPPPPTASQLAAQAAEAALMQSYQSAIAAGITITCTSTPAVNGTYPIDTLTQNKITQIEAFIQKNGVFPGTSGTSLAWWDTSGVAHVLPSVAIFSELATAIANYVADLDLYAAGALGVSLPSPSATIA